MDKEEQPKPRFNLMWLYLGIALLILLAGELWVAIRDKRLRQFGIGTAVLAAAALLSVMPSATNLWTTYEYGAYSIRGASELKSADGTKQSSGLDKDYALSWSYGKKETPTLLIPNVVGGASEPIGDAAGKVKDLHDPQIIDAVSRQSGDWGGRGWVPFVWDIPQDLVGRRLPLEIDVITSVRPIFGSDKSPDACLNHSLWTESALADPSPVGLRHVGIERHDSIAPAMKCRERSNR